MKKRSHKRREAWRRKVVVAVAVLIVLGLGGWGLWPGRPPSAGGTPRLALDRTEIDLGDLRFNAPASAAFNVTNTGDGPLMVKTGRVRAVQGC